MSNSNSRYLFHHRFTTMRLFSKLFFYLLFVIICILIIDGNLNYESEIRQFDIDMTTSAEQVGRIVAEMVSHTWKESDQQTAIQSIENANRASQNATISWAWLDETLKIYGDNNPELYSFEKADFTTPISFIATDKHRKKYRYTFVPVAISGTRKGLIQHAQTIEPLEDFTQKMLIRTLTITTLLALFSGIIIYFFIHIKIRGPLEKLSRKAIEIGKGNLVPDLDLKGEDELVSLGQIMNDMCTRLLIAKEKNHFEHLARLKTLEQLRHTEKLSTVGQIAAGIAHEVGTPLNVVDGRAKMIISEPLSHDEIVSCATIIKTQSERITLIIRQLLDFSRKKKSSLKTRENVATLISQVFHLLTPIAHGQDISLSLKSPKHAQFDCQMDAQQIQQVFMNVIMNSIQATPATGTVQVSIAHVMLKSAIHTDDQMKKRIRVEISDEGDGIPEEHLRDIFTPFFTTKQIGLGTGLGLSVARELVEEHGGWIDVENRHIKGARFSIFLIPTEAS